jgi:hypothetical protein
VKKTDLMRAIEKFDAQIASHQQAIDSLLTSKTMLEDVAKEKTQRTKASKKNKPAVAVRTRTVKAEKVDKVSAAADGVFDS